MALILIKYLVRLYLVSGYRKVQVGVPRGV